MANINQVGKVLSVYNTKTVTWRLSKWMSYQQKREHSPGKSKHIK